ncbi:iron-sulfur cluster biosynthesis family protein [Marininema halotolerans]|uniref:Iron-sulphur cluster biosynthesis n=1 Tax=Marininema halotolerans TaxID=1155944 RepID=A0A1I6QAG0_9BACL|nr:iron-sulfur cluster biosynthesis family protein [Marininema halotolerans]SFS49457.1 Iron-sulphur cluster biosynthesis [Marininema halotolerans]
MVIHIDGQTSKALHQKRPEETAALRLAVMNEGCGCGGDIWFEMNWDHPQMDDIAIHHTPIQVVLDPQSSEYFDQDLFLRYVAINDSFSLSSKNQIYLHHIHL